jgi:glycosyltransferase involved in cell wall biosynthesis
MRICIIGKFPPIQGGVSMRTYWAAHDLAARGHEVHVVTNAKEARPPFRMHMRRQDWKRCETAPDVASTSGALAGSVKVHWTDPLDNSQYYIPLASPFVSKLAATAARVHSERPFDVIYSHYLEPYGVAGHLAAEIAGVPHVVRMAGSDSGRLWRHPQLEMLYDHVLRSGAFVVATGAMAGRAIKRGVRPERIVAGGILEVSEGLFSPEGPKLDLVALRREIESDPDVQDMLWGGFAGDLPYFGIYGKLGDSKGSFALLAAMQRLKQAGTDVGLLAMAHGWPAVEGKFRARAEELGIADRILQIPFLPHWRVPEFLRSCLAVCCLEQDFPIVAHTPIVAREVLTCGACLVASTEVIRKVPDHVRLADGYGCVAIEDVQDIDALSARLAAIARDREPIAMVAARGRDFVRKVHAETRDPDRLERLLETAAQRRRPSMKRKRPSPGAEPDDPRFPITQLAARALQDSGVPGGAGAGVAPSGPIDLPQARTVLAAVERAAASGEADLRSVASGIGLEIAIAEAESTAPDEPPIAASDPLFRLRAKRWAMMEGDLAALIPMRDPQLRLLSFDISKLANGPGKAGAGPATTGCVVAFAPVNGERRAPMFVSAVRARILELSDGTRNARRVAEEVATESGRPAHAHDLLQEIEELFVSGLLWLNDRPIEAEERISGLLRQESADSAPPIPANDDRPVGADSAAAG